QVVAGGDAEAQPSGEGVGGGHRAGAAEGAFDVARAEAVPVDAVGGESGDFDVDGVGELGEGGGDAAADTAGQLFILGEGPRDVDAAGRHAAARLEGAWGEAGPEDDAVGGRIARGDAELEGPLGEPSRLRAAGEELPADGGSRGGEEGSSGESHRSAYSTGIARGKGLRAPEFLSRKVPLSPLPGWRCEMMRQGPRQAVRAIKMRVKFNAFSYSQFAFETMVDQSLYEE